MDKKNIIVVVGSFVALALIIGAVIVIIQNGNNSSKDKEAYRFEESTHMGVAQLASKSDVEKAIEGIGDTVTGPIASGVLYRDGIESETATYNFVVDGQNVRLDIDAKIYDEGNKFDIELKKENVFLATEPEVIDGVGEEAHMYFPVDDVTTGERLYSLIVLDGRKVMTLNLTLPADSEVALSRTAGQEILTKLGTNINLSNLNKTKS